MTVRYLGAAQFEAQIRGHKIFCDQPVGKGGFDEGMTPVEIMLASLGTCTGYYVVEYLKLNHLDTAGVEVSVDAEKVKNPTRLARFQVGIYVPLKLDAAHVEGLRHSVDKCLIKNTLLNAPAIETHVTAGERDPVIE